MQVEKLEDIGYKLEKAVRKSRTNSKALIKKYYTNQLALKLYGSFLLEVYNDSTKGNELVSRAEHEKQQLEKKIQQTGEKFNYFDNNNGILIISGKPENFGCVESMNHHASNILQIPIRFGLTMNVCSFIPPPANIPAFHNKAMQNYILNCKSIDVPIPFSTVFVDYSNFLVEVFLQVRCVALDSYPFFIAAFKRNTKDRETILYDTDGFIIHSTRGFPILLGYSEQAVSLKGVSGELLIPNFNKYRKTYAKGQVFDYTLPGTINKISMKFYQLTINSVTFEFLHATNNEAERESWFNEKPDLKDFNDLIELELESPENKEIEVVKYEKKGILKQPREKSNKDFNVKFDINPKVKYINETDFKPGTRIIGKEKDAAPVAKPNGKDEDRDLEKGDEEEEVKAENDKHHPINFGSNVIDLRDLDLLDMNENDGRSSNRNSSVASDLKIRKQSNGTSIASSSNSSNASFTSSAIAQMLLSGVTSSMLRFKISFFVTTVIVNIAILSMVIYMSITTNQFQDAVVVRDLTQRRILSSYLGIDGRNMQLIAVNQTLSETYDIVSVRLKNHVEEYNQIINAVSEGLQDQDGSYKKLYYSGEYESFDLIDNSIVKTTVNLMDLMRKLVKEGNSLASKPQSELDSSDSAFFYVLRNGNSETLKALNDSVYMLHIEEKKTLNQVLQILLILGVFAICLLIICLVAILIPTLLSVEQSNQTV